jgi:tRNA threonylcarbamoyladenosine biosynthesis protein TsaE
MRKIRPTSAARLPTSDAKHNEPDGQGPGCGQRQTTAVTKSAEETHQLGIRIGKSLRVPGVVLLRGPLGVGKTTLTRGIAAGLGLEDPSRVSSPSFALVNHYRARCPIYHVDLYRLDGARDLYTIGLEEFMGREGVTIIEWSERLTFPVESAVVVDIADAGDDSRIIDILHFESTKQRSGTSLKRNGPARSNPARKRAGPRRTR